MLHFFAILFENAHIEDSVILQLTHLWLASGKRDIGNNVDPDQTPQNAVSDQCLHRLHFLKGISIKHGTYKT